MSNHKLIILLVALAVYFFPIDMNIILNRIVGWGTHWILFFLIVIAILITIEGKTLKQKWKNLFKEVNGK